jgi:hypothetical protein
MGAEVNAIPTTLTGQHNGKIAVTMSSALGNPAKWRNPGSETSPHTLLCRDQQRKYISQYSCALYVGAICNRHVSETVVRKEVDARQFITIRSAVMLVSHTVCVRLSM